MRTLLKKKKKEITPLWSHLYITRVTVSDLLTIIIWWTAIVSIKSQLKWGTFFIVNTFLWSYNPVKM